MRLMKHWLSEILWNAPGEGSGGAAADAGGTAVTGTSADDGDANASVLSRNPVAEGADDAGKKDTAKEGEEGKQEGAGAAEADPLDAVPEDGVYQYALPEGMAIDETVGAEMGTAFKEAGLTQKQVNAVVERYAALVQKDQETRVANIDGTLTDWLNTARADSEIGGDKWDASIANANRVLDKFGDPEVEIALRQTGAGVHPAILRMLARAGAAIADDTFTPGGQAVEQKSLEDRMYEKTTPAGKRA